MWRLILLCLAICIPYITFGDSNTAHKRRVLVIGIDGLTGNQLHESMFERNIAPNLLKLAHNGRYAACPNHTSSLCARTHDGNRYNNDFLWVTSSGWAAVVSGLNASKHLVKDNDYKNQLIFSKVTQKFPTMFKVAQQHGLKTAAGGVGAFLTSYDGDDTYAGIIDYECGYDKKGPRVDPDQDKSCNLDYRKTFNNTNSKRDEKLLAWLKKIILTTDTDLIMGVFDRVDEAGHAHGFYSNDDYLDAITAVDKLIKSLIEATSSTDDEWLYIITSDHGGHRILFRGAHDRRYDEDEVVPFIISTNTSVDLKPLTYPIRHMDTNPTALKWLGIAPIKTIDGRVQGL